MNLSNLKYNPSVFTSREFLLKTPDGAYPPKDLSDNDGWQSAEKRIIPNDCTISDFLKSEFGISKTDFKRKLENGNIRNCWGVIKEDRPLSGLEDFKIGRRLSIDLWLGCKE